jgi:2-methylcitrate dehydratase PrpD
VQNALAARGGLLGAQLAASGMRGAARGLEGQKGLMRSLAGLDAVPEWDAAPAVDTILDVWAKPWATLGDNVPAVAAAHALRASGIDVRHVTRLDVTLWRHYAEYPGTSHRGPFDTVAQALASTAFAVCAMLTFGELDYAVSVNRRGDPAVARLLPLVRIQPHDGEWHEASIAATLADGSTVRRTCADGPRALMFQDRATAIALFEQRLVASGSRAGTGADAAAAVFRAADGLSDVGVREVLDRLAGSDGP